MRKENVEMTVERDAETLPGSVTLGGTFQVVLGEVRSPFLRWDTRPSIVRRFWQKAVARNRTINREQIGG